MTGGWDGDCDDKNDVYVIRYLWGVMLGWVWS